MARSLPKVCPFLVTVDLKLKWPELPVARITPPYLTNFVHALVCRAAVAELAYQKVLESLHHIRRYNLSCVITSLLQI